MEGILPANRIARRAVWAILAALLLVTYSCFFFDDLRILYDNAMIFWEGIFQGKSPLEFYEYSVGLSRTDWPANYNFFPYLILSLWCLPFMAYCKLRGIDYFPLLLGRMWFKLLVFLLLLLATYLLMRVLKQLGKDRTVQRTSAFIFLSSILTLVSTLIVSNVDIIAICFMLASILCLLRGRNVWFIAFLAMAVACKSFALLYALPLILYTEKNAFKAVGKIACTTIVVVAEKILFMGSPTYGYALKANSEHGLSLLFERNFTRSALFVLLLIFAAVVCYLHAAPRLAEPNERHLRAMQPKDGWNVIYIGAFVFGSLAMCINMSTYWILYVAPFLALLCVRDELFAPFLTLIESLVSLCYLLLFSFLNGAIQTPELVGRGILSKFSFMPPEECMRFTGIKGVLSQTPIGSLQDGYPSAFVALMIVMLVLAHPYISNKLKDKIHLDKTISAIVPWLRIAVCVCVVGLLIYARLASVPEPTFSNLDAEATPASTSLMVEDQTHTYAQALQTGEASKLTTLTLMFDNPSENRHNFSSVSFEVWDTTSNTCLWHERIGSNQIEDDQPYTIDLKGVAISPDHTHELRLVGNAGSQANAGVRLFPYVCATTDASATSQKAQLDGRAQDYVLQYELR